MKTLFTISIAIFLIFSWFASAQEIGNPIIESISPSSGTPDASITIKGRNFAETTSGNLIIFYQGSEAKGTAMQTGVKAATATNPQQEIYFKVPNIAADSYSVRVASSI